MKIPMKNIVFAHCSESRLQRLATGCIVEFVASRCLAPCLGLTQFQYNLATKSVNNQKNECC